MEISASPQPEVTVIGAGLVGCMAALHLAQRRYRVRVFESRPDPRQSSPQRDRRSVHLVISERGWRALRKVGLEEVVRGHSLQLQGRLIHSETGCISFQPYGREDQAIFAISRNTLGTALLQHVLTHPLITVSFGTRCHGISPGSGTLELENIATGMRSRFSCDRILATDGTHSKVRLSLIKQPCFDYSQRYMRHGYKELTLHSQIPGVWPLQAHGMHVWPRREGMLVAFPNPDHNFTCTLILPSEGSNSFEALRTPEALFAFFRAMFPDALPLMPALADEFFAGPPSALASVRCSPWVHAEKLLLLGDAAHAMVPFFGQGMNAGFEDCTVLDECLERNEHAWGAALKEFQSARVPDCEAVIDLSERHFTELSEKVGDPRFLLQKKIEQEIHRLFPDRFIPLYAMVAFTHIPYAQIRRRAYDLEVLAQRFMEIENIESKLGTPEFDAVARHLLADLAPLRSVA